MTKNYNIDKSGVYLHNLNMTKIIATIGPASESDEVLEYFHQHDVSIAKLKAAYNTDQWHADMGLKLKNMGFEVWFDMTGPKVVFGDLSGGIELLAGDEVFISHENIEGAIPVSYDMTSEIRPGHKLLALDGLFQLEVTSVEGARINCKVISGGVLESNKSLLAPGVDFDLSPVVGRDVKYLETHLNNIEPEWIALSFVKNIEDVKLVKAEVERIKTNNEYKPKYAVKIETVSAMKPDNMRQIMQECDMVVVARGDLALQIEPLHINVPFSQEVIIKTAKEMGVDVCVATQLLYTMIGSPVPSRAEVSDLYRAVHLDQAEYLYLSNETAVGKYPKEVVKVASDMIRFKG